MALFPRKPPPAHLFGEKALPASEQPDLEDYDDLDLPAGDVDEGFSDDDLFPNTTRPSDDLWPRTEAVNAAGVSVIVARDDRRRSITVYVPIGSPCSFYLHRMQQDVAASVGFLLEPGQPYTLGTRSGFRLTPSPTGAVPTALAPALISILTETWWESSADHAQTERRRHGRLLERIADAFR